MMNRHQPIRPRHDEITGQPLLYRTMPDMESKRFAKVCSYPARIAQMRLYRAARAEEIPQNVAIGELYEYLFADISDTVKKFHLGSAVMPSLMYDPRLLKNNKRDGTVSTYIFRHQLELQYGLEWQICIWLRKFLNEGRPRNELISGPERMEQELDLLANYSEIDYHSFYEDGSFEFHMEEPHWPSVVGDAMEWEPPAATSDFQPRNLRPRPRDLNDH